MGIFGGFEWILIIVIIILFFGAKRIPNLARGIGQGIQEFRNARHDPDEEEKLDEEKE